MKCTKSMKLNKDFKRMYYRGKSAVTGNVVVYTGKNRMKFNRIGITCGKTIGKAVKRNRVKRLIKESYRLIEKRLCLGNDIVIVARTRAVSSKFKYVMNDLEKAFGKLGLFNENEKNSD